MKIILMKFPGEELGAPQILNELGETASFFEVQEEAMVVYHGVDSTESYVYLQIPLAGEEGSEIKGLQGLCQALHEALLPGHPMVEVRWMEKTLDVAGHSVGKSVAWHYVVETDVLPAAEDDFNDWYSSEHLPGLAAVPGTIRAARYVSDEAAPKYYAAYDLETRETFGSGPWLAVRGTEWSSRVRPNFVNTKRTMFKKASGSF